METKPQCSKRVYSGQRWDWGGHQCHKPGKVQVGDKWYCATHDPEAEKKRKEKQEANWEAQQKADREKWAREAYDRKAGDACRALGIVDPETELPALVKREE